MPRVLLVDDHAMVREGLTHILASSHQRLEVGEAENAQQALEKVQAESWDAVIMDVTLPGRNGVQALKEFKREHPSFLVLILSVHPETQYAVGSLRAGASGYLCKASAAEKLLEAVGKILKGRKYISAELAENLAGDVALGSHTQPHQSLSDHEFQVFCLIASGNASAVIAKNLSLSVKTVHTHRRRILKKMGMKNNSEFTHYGFKHSLVD